MLLKQNLVELNDSVLVVIDIQDSFLTKYDNAVSQALVTKVAWLLRFAEALNVPIIAMAEDIENAGNLNQTILDALPDRTAVHDKNIFNLVENTEIFASIEATGRKTTILVGMETDVCVAHSALGLLQNSYKVVALKDGMATTAEQEEIGLSRMSEAGVVITSIKGLVFEWLRGVKNTRDFFKEYPELDKQLPNNLLL